MILKRFYEEKLAQASFLVGCSATGEAIVIDPNRDIAQYIAAADAEKLRITAVTETHIHADFLSGARELAAAAHCMLYLSAEGGPDWLYAYADEDANVITVCDGDSIRVGNIRLDVIHTPGHTPEHITLQLVDHGICRTNRRVHRRFHFRRGRRPSRPARACRRHRRHDGSQRTPVVRHASEFLRTPDLLDALAGTRRVCEPVGLARAHRRLEHLHAVAADALGVIHRQFGVLEHFFGAVLLAIREREADRGGEKDFAVVEGDRRTQRLAERLGEGEDLVGLPLGQDDAGELITGEASERVLRLEQAPEPAGERQQDRSRRPRCRPSR